MGPIIFRRLMSRETTAGPCGFGCALESRRLITSAQRFGGACSGSRLDRECGRDGVFLGCPVSTDHPAIHVQMNRGPGWADFGRGVIPDGLNVTVLPVLPMLHFFGVRQAAVGAFSDALHSILGSNHLFERLASFAGRRSDVIKRAVVQFAADPDVKNLADRGKWHTGLDPSDRFDCQDYRRLREARGMSLRDVARAVTDLLPESPVDDDRIRRFELGRQTRVEYLRSRLDTVYGADGRTCWEEIDVRESSPGQAQVTFPAFWVGPVTITAFKKSGTSEPFQQITITWAEWETHVQLKTGTTVTLRQCSSRSRQVRVAYPPSWGISAGIGYEASAVDINSGWHPTDKRQRSGSSLSALSRSISEYSTRRSRILSP